MSKQKAIDWEIPPIDQSISKFERYLRGLGFAESTVLDYVGRARRYLNACDTSEPTEKDAIKFRDGLIDRRLSKSSINNYSFVIKIYHRMIGEAVELPHIKNNDKLPYFFDEKDVQRIFDATTNIKYRAVLQIGFYAGLRTSEIANLDDSDIDLTNNTVRVRSGKNDRDSLLYINDKCAETLRLYLKRRPRLEINRRYPLFYSNQQKRYDRKMIYNIFRRSKARSGIIKPGGAHVFFRHSSATLLLKRGCDLLTVKELLRHKDIKTTEKYLHLTDEVKRSKYDRFLKL
jgi:integrase/recombinase XerD